MSNTASGDTALRSEVRGHANGADIAIALSPGNTPCTTVVAAALGPKLPPFMGDSWRPVVAGLLGAVPLVAAAVTGASVMGVAAATSPRHAVVVPAQHGVTVAAGALASPKYPDKGAD